MRAGGWFVKLSSRSALLRGSVARDRARERISRIGVTAEGVVESGRAPASGLESSVRKLASLWGNVVLPSRVRVVHVESTSNKKGSCLIV